MSESHACGTRRAADAGAVEYTSARKTSDELTKNLFIHHPILSVELVAHSPRALVINKLWALFKLYALNAHYRHTPE